MFISIVRGGILGAILSTVISFSNCSGDLGCYQKNLSQSGWQFGALAGGIVGIVAYSPLRRKAGLSPENLGLISLGFLGYSIATNAVNFGINQVQDNIANFDKTPARAKELFADIQSPGNLGIALAEGTKDEQGRETALINGHTDPATLGRRRVRNQGFCSDFGRTAPGDIDGANRGCLSRIKSRLPRLTRLFLQQGLNPSEHIEAYWNAVDLWNQGSPFVSDNFPGLYANNLKSGKSTDDAIRKARVDSFELKANGLYHICRNFEPFKSKLTGLAINSREWKERCTDLDQNRRRIAGEIVMRRNGVIN
ncbi:MAG: hypothetical protein KME64_42850 [Scytonematopsis contorta HA4267-MV1]|jgi:D-alanyl-D-alanine dipeptidase|nr:hypothetical protein [Scytonematopsis contorta HA4267-MV1]